MRKGLIHLASMQASWEDLTNAEQRAAVIVAGAIDMAWHADSKQGRDSIKKPVLLQYPGVTEELLERLVARHFLTYQEETDSYRFTHDDIRQFCLAEIV